MEPFVYQKNILHNFNTFSLPCNIFLLFDRFHNVFKFVVMELEKRKSLPNHLQQITNCFDTIGADFAYCASIIEVTEIKEATAKALAAVVQEQDNFSYYYLPSGEKKETPYKCWQVANVSQMTAASLFLGEKKQPAVLTVSLRRKEQIPSDQLLPFLHTVAKEFKGELKLWLKYSFDDYEPVDSAIEQLKGTG